MTAIKLDQQLKEELSKVVENLFPDQKISSEDVSLEHPNLEEYGDFSSSVALKLAKNVKENPVELATKVVQKLDQSSSKGVIFEKVMVAGPGFVNFFLSKEFLQQQVPKIQTIGDDYGKGDYLAGQKISVEHTGPNPQTTIMIGHLRNNFLGMTMGRLWKSMGAEIFLDCMDNDRGTHLCRSMFGYLAFANKNDGLLMEELKDFREVSEEKILQMAGKINWQERIQEWSENKDKWFTPNDLGVKSDHANLIWYVLGSKVYGLDDVVKKQVGEILVAWEKPEPLVRALWRMILDWSVQGYAQTYQRIGSHHDKIWHESEHYQKGKDIVAEGLKKGVFVESQGAVVTNLESYKLPDTVVVKADGTGLYLTQDIALTKIKRENFKADLYVWDVGEEQSLYFQQLFAVCEQLGIGKRKDYFHLSFALVNLKGGKKMSTRKGDVIPADDVLDELQEHALEIMEASKTDQRNALSETEKRALAEKIAIAAVKYGMLRVGVKTTIQFDIDESLSLDGDSGPYIQYSYARARSLLRKATEQGLKAETGEVNPNLAKEELEILRYLYRFPEVTEQAARQIAPNLVASYLFEMAKRFNAFYNQVPVLAGEQSEVSFRLALVEAVSQVLKNGLGLLGIEALEKM
jgi:arginyl-tRNA synthetase